MWLLCAVDSPALQHAFGVAVLARPADVVHHFGLAILDNRLTNPAADVVERCVPGGAFPFALAALAGTLERVEDAFRIVDLVDRRRTLGAVATATGRMDRIALQLANLAAFLIDVGQQATGRLAVEADRRHHQEVALDPVRPGERLILHPVVPLLGRRVGGKLTGAVRVGWKR